MPKVFSDEQENKIKTFIKLALDFNKTHNIFSRESYDEVYENDILDCKPLINHIKKERKCIRSWFGRRFPRNTIINNKTRKQNKLIREQQQEVLFSKKSIPRAEPKEHKNN